MRLLPSLPPMGMQSSMLNYGPSPYGVAPVGGMMPPPLRPAPAAAVIPLQPPSPMQAADMMTNRMVQPSVPPPLPPSPPPLPQSGGGFFGKLNAGMGDMMSGDHSNMLIALGGSLLNYSQDARNPMFDSAAMMRGAQLDSLKTDKTRTRNGTVSFAQKQFGLDQQTAQDLVDTGQFGTYYAAKLKEQSDKQQLLNLGDGQFARVGQNGQPEFFASPNAKKAAPTIQEFFDPQTHQPYKAQWNGTGWDKIGGDKAPAKGMSFQTNPDGTVSFSEGGDLTKPTENKIQEGALNAMGTLDRLNAIDQSYKPEYQQYGTKLAMGFSSLKDKLTGLPAGPERDKLAEYTSFRTNAATNLSQTLHELSGAAVSPNEGKRIGATMPDPDGDSPTQFEAKTKQASKLQRLALARYQWAMKNGVSQPWTKMSLEDTEGMIEKRGAELEKTVQQQFPNAGSDQVRKAVADRLRSEFGM